MDRLRPINVALILAVSLLFSGFIVAKTIPAKPESTSLHVQAVGLTKTVSLEYRYVNGILKYIAVKNVGKPVEITMLGQYKVIGQNDSYVIAAPLGVKVIKLDILNYEPQEGSQILNFDKKLSTSTYVLLLPEMTQGVAGGAPAVQAQTQTQAQTQERTTR